jgi:hypothetical protein
VVRHDDQDAGLLEARKSAWRELAEPVRVSFTWPAPGEPRDGQVPFPAIHPDQETPLSHFCLLILDPHEVDVLELNGNPQHRCTYRRVEPALWLGTEVNP